MHKSLNICKCGRKWKQKPTFLFPVFVGVLLGNDEKDENDEDQQQTDPDAVEPAGRRQVKVTGRCRHTHHTYFNSGHCR